MPRKKQYLLVDGLKKRKNKADTKYTFEHGEDMNYTLDGVSITPSYDKYIGVIPNSVARVEENRSGISY